MDLTACTKSGCGYDLLAKFLSIGDPEPSHLDPPGKVDLMGLFQIAYGCRGNDSTIICHRIINFCLNQAFDFTWTCPVRHASSIYF